MHRIVKKLKNGIQFFFIWQTKEMRFKDNNVLATTEVNEMEINH